MNAFRQCSHINAETPRSIHEGGELGCALSVAFGSVTNHPHLILACVVGDGETETETETETVPIATYVATPWYLSPQTNSTISTARGTHSETSTLQKPAPSFPSCRSTGFQDSHTLSVSAVSSSASVLKSHSKSSPPPAFSAKQSPNCACASST